MDEKYKKLMEKYKNKCKKLNKANEKINYFNERKNIRDKYEHIHHLNHEILCDLTAHLDINYYDITYEYNKKNYREDKVKSFGLRWIKQALSICLAEKHNLIIYLWSLEIIYAKKL